MATVAQLITDIAHAKNTASGKVEYNGNSLQSILLNDVTALLLGRGVYQVANTTALQAVGASESLCCGINGTGIFFWQSSGTPDYSSSFPASGGGIWVKQNYTQSLALSNLTDVFIPTTPHDNQILSFSGGKWIASTASNSLAALTDVAITSIADGEVIYYNSTSGKYVNSTTFKLTGVNHRDITTIGNLSIANITATGAITAASVATSGAVSVGSNLTVASDAQISGSLDVNGGAFVVDAGANNVQIAVDLLINTNKFTVAEATGNTTVAGTLSIAGISTLTGEVVALGNISAKTGGGVTKFSVVSATGNTSIAGTLAVTGATTITGALTTASDATVGGIFWAQGTAEISGDLSVNNGNFYVYAATGNVECANITGGNFTANGTLSASGNFAIATNKFTVASATGNLAVNINKFTVAGATGNTLVAGTFDVSGVTTLSSDVTVAGDATLSGDSTFNGAINALAGVGIANGQTLDFATNTFSITGGIAGTTLAAVGTDKYVPITLNGVAYKVKLFS